MFCTEKVAWVGSALDLERGLLSSIVMMERPLLELALRPLLSLYFQVFLCVGFLFMPGHALAINCDAISFSDAKILCKSWMEKVGDVWEPRENFNSSVCTSIRDERTKAFCFATDQGGESRCEGAFESQVEEDLESDIRDMCSFFGKFGRAMRQGVEPNRSCNLDDKEFDAFCDAMGKGDPSPCSRVSIKSTRGCKALVDIISQYFAAVEESKARENWLRAKSKVISQVNSANIVAERERGEAPSSDRGLAERPLDVKQQEFTRVEYTELWEAHQGKSMSEQQLRTLMRGCVGITAANLKGGGDPLDSAVEMYDDLGKAIEALNNKNAVLDWLQNSRNGKVAAQWLTKGKPIRSGRFVLFGKLYWSNQNVFLTEEERSERSPSRFPADEITREVDPENFRRKYNELPRPDRENDDGTVTQFINFDYGFYDEGSKSFWHANHMEHLDPESAKSDPMKVYQSSPSKFTAGYVDFDQTVFAIAFAESFNAKSAATFWGNKL